MYADDEGNLTHEYKPFGMEHHSYFGVAVVSSIRGFKVKSWLPDEVTGGQVHDWLVDNEPFNELLDMLTSPSSPYFVIKFIELQSDMVIIHMEDDCVAIYRLEEVRHVESEIPDTVRATDEGAGARSVESSSEGAPA